MTTESYYSKAPEFFSLHYRGRDLADAIRLGLPHQKALSFQAYGRGKDGNYYHVGLSGANNPLGNFIFIGSSSQEETHFFRELVVKMEKRYGGQAKVFTYALNEHRYTASIPIGEPAVLTDLLMLEKFLKSELSMSDMEFDLYFDDLPKKPKINVLGKVNVRAYTVEEHEGFTIINNGQVVVQEPYITRTYLDE